MAVDGFGATTEEMTRAAQHVAGVNQSVQGELSALRSRLEPLAGAWVGRAAAQFNQPPPTTPFPGPSGGTQLPSPTT